MGKQAEVAEQGLVVDAAQRGVVDDALRAGDEGCEAGEAVASAVRASPPGVGTHSTSRMMRPWTSVGAGGDEHELDAPGGLAVAFEVQAGVGIGARRADLAGRACRGGCRRAGPGRGG